MSASRTIVLAMMVWLMVGKVCSQPASSPTAPSRDSLSAQVLGQRAKELSAAGDYAQAVEWGRKALDATERQVGIHHHDYATALTLQAGYLSRSGHYAEAIVLAQQAMTLSEELSGTQTADYAQLLNNLARYHSYVGNYIEAVRLGRKAVELRAQLFGK